MQKISRILTGLTPILAFVFIYYVLRDPFIMGTYDMGNILFLYILILAIAAGLTRDTTKLLHSGDTTQHRAYVAVAVSTGLITSAFFINTFEHMLLGLLLIVISQITWFWVVFKKAA